ncbi:MAG: CPCC family cysteine-rich protein [Pseudomonadota bacterium]
MSKANESGVLHRRDAIRAIAADDAQRLSADERADRLFDFCAEDWSDEPDWMAIEPAIRDALEDDDVADPMDPRFEPAPILRLAAGFAGATNAYLLERLNAIRSDVRAIEGELEARVACPCCGRRTLRSRGDFEICPVCWWEDDGQDNKRADDAYGGPNGSINLTQARRNAIVHGLYDPKRVDLAPKCAPAEKYPRGRVFVLDEDAGVIAEQGANWTARIDPAASD